MRYLAFIFVLTSCATYLPETSRTPAALFSCHETFRALFDNPLAKSYEVVAKRKAGIAYPNAASLEQIRLVKEAPAKVRGSKNPSPGLIDREIEEARVIGGVFEDYKPLSDAKPRELTASQFQEINEQAKRVADDSGYESGSLEHRRLYLKESINGREWFAVCCQMEHASR